MRRLLILFTLAVASSAAFAQFTPQYDPNKTLGNPGQDQDFLEAAMKYSTAEVEWSKIAIAKSADTDVRALANDVVSEELPIAGQLVAQAKSFKLKVPDGTKGKEKKISDKLNSLSGAEFDKTYVAELIKLQHDDVGNALNESKESRDRFLPTFATQIKDKVAARNDRAKAVQAKVGK